jgi:hypothetical protein
MSRRPRNLIPDDLPPGARSLGINPEAFRAVIAAAPPPVVPPSAMPAGLAPADPIPADLPPGGPLASVEPPARGMNETERQFAGHLERLRLAGLVLWYAFEPIRVRLADRSEVWYKPDFGAVMADWRFVLFEVKGRWREAARVRIKIAASLSPFPFIAVRKGGSSGGLPTWSFETFPGCRLPLIGATPPPLASSGLGVPPPPDRPATSTPGTARPSS